MRKGDKKGSHGADRLQELRAKVSELEKLAGSLRESEERYRAIFDYANDAIFLMNGDQFINCNSKTLEMFGCTREQIIGQPPYLFSPPCQPDGRDSKEKALEKIKATLQGKPQSFDWKHCMYDGTSFDAEVNLNKIVVGGKIFIQAIVRDISERKKTEDTIKHIAYHDALTKLPNRLLFILIVAMNLSRRKEEKLAVMMLDIDRFKEVNDTLGHDFGDMLLMIVADRISSILRKSDTVARMGGDEFMVLLPEIARAEDSLAVAEKIRVALREPVKSNGHTMCTSVSIGISIYPDHALDAVTLLKYADIAMYRAKEEGRDRVVLFL